MKTKRIFLCLLSLLLAFGNIFAQQDKTEYYIAKSYVFAGITLPYRELDLNQEKDGSSILVIQLHGGSARGNDNIAQLYASAVDSVEQYLVEHEMKAIFLLPQCAADRLWNESPHAVTTPMTAVLRNWIRNFLLNNDVDTSRIYITGYSAGGSGTWRMLNDNTKTFAGACVAAANPVMVTAENVKETPVYAIAGSDDNIMNATTISDFVASLVSLGGEAMFDLLEGQDHFGTCDTAFTTERLDWMFAHSRNGKSGDVNGDGNVTAADVTALYNWLLNNDDSAIVNGDQNSDGFITAADITFIYNILLGSK